MKILFSRHAQRRMKLYQIDESDIIAILDRNVLIKTGISGKVVFIDEPSAQKYKFPLKVVATVEDSIIMVVTVYPLKKGSKL